jgi:hypothetical protein
MQRLHVHAHLYLCAVMCWRDLDSGEQTHLARRFIGILVDSSLHDSLAPAHPHVRVFRCQIGSLSGASRVSREEDGKGGKTASLKNS